MTRQTHHLTNLNTPRGSRRRAGWLVAGVTTSLALLPGTADAAVRTGSVVLKKVDTVTIGTETYAVTFVDGPTTTGTGKVGLHGEFSVASEQFIWVDGAVVWREFELGRPIYTIDDAIGVADGGKFSFTTYASESNATGSTTTDMMVTHDGVVLAEGDAAPGFASGALISAVYESQMAANGDAFSVCNVSESGNTSSSARALYRINDGGTVITPVITSGASLAGTTATINDTSFGVDTDFGVSLNGAHYAVVVDLDTSSTTDDAAIVVDGALVARENDPINSGENLDNFTLVGVNDLGNWIGSGDSDGSTTKDEYLLYNGAPIVREGETLAGYTIPSSSNLEQIRINDDGHIYHHWDNTSGAFAYVTCDPNLVADRTTLILEEGDELDVDNDTIGDFTVTTLLATEFADRGRLGSGNVAYIEAEITDGMTDYEAVIEIPYGCCGNGMLELAEQCDDGNAVNDDGCTNACNLAVCGDGIVQSGEACDDGNQNDQDACTNACAVAVCGDGVIQNGVEECDDANSVDDDACTNACTAAACGDGILQVGEGEECDDGNATNDDGCTNACTNPVCGDGIVQAGEGCDDGNSDDTDSCTTICALPSCGDGLNQPGEECDDGNAEDTDMCTNNCTQPVCGDGVTTPSLGEQCDDQNIINDDACSNLCRDAVCGDGVVQDGESCDDGNLVNDDECTSACQTPECGDGYIQDGEECDDGNEADMDGCSSDCVLAVCGDGQLQEAIGEECDDGNTEDGDGCSSTCLPEAGDGDGDGDGDDDGDDDGGMMTDGMDTDGMGAGSSDDGGCAVDDGARNLGRGLLALLGFGLLGGLGRRRRRRNESSAH